MAQPARFLDAGGRSRIRPIGGKQRPLEDLYHSWLVAPWSRVFALVFVLYLSINALFASGYLLLGDALQNARPHSFLDAFFFSVQTLSTIGYGNMVPKTLGANLLVTLEALVGLVGTAITTGLMFAKFSRPTSRVLWSERLIVGMFDGHPSVMFRMANERGNQVVEAQLRFLLLRSEQTVEGITVRRVLDLKLQRAQSGAFVLSWLAVHRITPDSPLYGVGLAALRATGSEFAAALTGLDESFGQTIHSRHTWGLDDLAVGARFEDIMLQLPTGERVMDYGRFHSARPHGAEELAKVKAALGEPA